MNHALLILAVSSGLFAAFSPCSLPVYPVLLNRLARGDSQRRIASAVFAAGVAATFCVFYLAVGFLIKLVGDSVYDSFGTVYSLLYALAAFVCFMFAAQSLGFVRFYGRTLSVPAAAGAGVHGAFVAGAFFGAILTPCNVPFIMVGVLPALLDTATMIEGLALMVSFSIGLSTPILTLGVLSSHAMDSWLRRHVRQMEKASVAFLVVAGFYFLYLTAYGLNAV